MINMAKLLHQLRWFAWLMVASALASEPGARSNMEVYWPQWRGPLATAWRLRPSARPLE